MPLNGRNFLQLAQLTPGTIPPVLQNSQDTTSSFNGNRTNLSVGISGTREVSAAYLFDGILGREEYYGAVAVQPVLEGLAEFKIMRGYFAPEFGSPAIVSVVTKSRTNDVSLAALWEFLRNDIFDARNTFDFSGTKPPFRQNQFGGSFGGPIIKDKLFFQVDSELLRARQSLADNLRLPTPAMLQGNFQGFPTIYDPSTAGPNRVKQPYPNNIIPANQIGSFAAKYNPYVLTSPLSPLDPSVVSSGLNYFGTQRTVTDENKWDVRVDFNISSKDKIYGRLTYDLTDETVAIPQPGANRIYPLHSWLAVLAWSHVFSPSMVNEARVGLDRAFLQAGGPVPGGNSNWPAFFGLQNISLTPRCSGVPTLSLAQYGTFGFPSTSCIDSTNNNIPFFDNVSWVKGRHIITFGGEIERINLRHEVAFGPEGSFTFTGQFTQGFDGTNLIPNTGNVMADYLLGFPSAANAQALVTPTYRRGWYGALHVNDDFKVSPTLTLNLGLRYEVEPPLIEKYNHISQFNFATGTQEFAGTEWQLSRSLLPGRPLTISARALASRGDHLGSRIRQSAAVTESSTTGCSGNDQSVAGHFSAAQPGVSLSLFLTIRWSLQPTLPRFSRRPILRRAFRSVLPCLTYWGEGIRICSSGRSASSKHCRETCSWNSPMSVQEGTISPNVTIAISTRHCSSPAIPVRRSNASRISQPLDLF